MPLLHHTSLLILRHTGDEASSGLTFIQFAGWIVSRPFQSIINRVLGPLKIIRDIVDRKKAIPKWAIGYFCIFALGWLIAVVSLQLSIRGGSKGFEVLFNVSLAVFAILGIIV